MTKRVNCKSCDNLILPETAQANSGLCAVCKKSIKKHRPAPKTPDELLTLDQESPYEWSELADELYRMMSDFVCCPRDLYPFDKPVMTFYASMKSFWLVQESGFSMAAYNGPEWIPYGSIAFKELGKPLVASVLMEAAKMIPDELALQDSLHLHSKPTAKSLSQYLDTSPIKKLDRLIISSDWEVSAKTMKYVRDNRAAFNPGSQR
jgi:hypothetical protein